MDADRLVHLNFNSRSCEGATEPTKKARKGTAISTHAPVKVRPKLSRPDCDNLTFQLTLL